MSEIVEIFKDGLWRKNPGLVQLLGLCPLLAVSSSITNALGLGLATIFVLTLSNMAISCIRRIVKPDVRIIIYVIVIASLVTCVQLVMEAFTPDLYAKLGLYVGLIVTNCIIIARAEVFAAKNTPILAAADGLANGLGFTLVLLAVGTFREILGHGTVFSGLGELVGLPGEAFTLQVLPQDSGLLLAILPPGAFITLGLLLALKNAVDTRRNNVKSRVRHNETTDVELHCSTINDESKA